MPTYDYECEACGYSFERFQPISQRAIRKCPKCGRLKVRRLIGAGGGILFRGSGFYQTDYRSESYRKAAEKDKPGGKSKAGGEASSASKDAHKDSPKDQ
ncbi:MAG: FmdB family zinc ribbon protein [Planctomycetota bacterium]